MREGLAHILQATRFQINRPLRQQNLSVLMLLLFMARVDVNESNYNKEVAEPKVLPIIKFLIILNLSN
jgi:hypothetical protein